MRGRDNSLTIDYHLAKDAGQVTIDILDASGGVLRSFTGSAKDAPAAPNAPSGGFGGAQARPGIKTGMNRFTWDLRQSGSVVFPGMIMWAAQPARGPASPPGRYSVRVTANGDTQTRAFTIGLDPRLAAAGITEAFLLEQFKLSSQVRDRVTDANAAVIKIRVIRAQVEERVQKIPERRRAEVQRLVDALMKPLTAVEEEVYQVRNRSNQDPLNYPIKLNNKIAALMGVIESADHRPTDQAYQVFQELSERLEQQLQQMNATIKTELPRLNAALKRDKVDAVDPDATPAAPPAEKTKP